jgi:hypothetical protein
MLYRFPEAALKIKRLRIKAIELKMIHINTHPGGFMQACIGDLQKPLPGINLAPT